MVSIKSLVNYTLRRDSLISGCDQVFQLTVGRKGIHIARLWVGSVCSTETPGFKPFIL